MTEQAGSLGQPTAAAAQAEPGITTEDKYAVVVANLLYAMVRRIPRYLVTDSEPYTILKELVVKETDLSDYQRSEKLHALPALGDQRPSDLLASIRNL